MPLARLARASLALHPQLGDVANKIGIANIYILRFREVSSLYHIPSVQFISLTTWYQATAPRSHLQLHVQMVFKMVVTWP